MVQYTLSPLHIKNWIDKKTLNPQPYTLNPPLTLTKPSLNPKPYRYSDTSLRAMSMQGGHGSLRVAITAASLAGTISAALSFDVPLLTTQNRTNWPARGGSSLTVTGLGLAASDYTSKLRVGATDGLATR